MYRYGTLRDGEVAFPEDGGQVLVYTDANGVPQPDPGGGTGVQSVSSGANIQVDNTDDKNPIINATGLVKSTTVLTIVKLTQAEYDAIPSPVATTMYVIVG